METPSRHFPPSDNSPLDEALRSHLGRQLDPHLGNARRGFETMLAREAMQPTPPLRLRRSRWFIGLAAAAAACVVFGMGSWLGQSETTRPAGPVAGTNRPLDPRTHESGDGMAEQESSQEPVPSHGFGTLELDPSDAGRFLPVRQDEVWRARNLGTYVVDGQPVRAVERQGWQTVQYETEAGARVSIETPRHQVLLIDASVQ